MQRSNSEENSVMVVVMVRAVSVISGGVVGREGGEGEGDELRGREGRREGGEGRAKQAEGQTERHALLLPEIALPVVWLPRGSLF